MPAAEALHLNRRPNLQRRRHIQLGWTVAIPFLLWTSTTEQAPRA